MAGIRVVIDARLTSGLAGGVEGVVIGLAHGLSQLDGPDEFTFLTRDGGAGWLDAHVAGGVRIATEPAPRPAGGTGGLGGIGRIARRLRRAMPGRPTAASRPQLDTFVRGLRPDVVHLPIQRGFLADVPSIYHPHDLQHMHLPDFFTDEQRAWRERWYGELCRRSSMVAVVSEWTRQDVIRHYELTADKVRVVPLAPPLSAAREPTADERAEIHARLGLPDRYVLYAAQTWPHKNHRRLLEALATLRAERGLVVPLVATGRQTPYVDELIAAARALGVADQVTWTGFLSAPELRAVLHDATAVVIPTLFEAASGPLWEAFDAGVPAACSNVTSLPEQAGDAAIVFDPLDVAAIADAVAALWTDDGLRRTLAARGRAQVAELSWERTARIFRAHYRRLAGVRLGDEDRSLVG